MSRLPSGTVTFLFTDIEGSTRLLNELGDAYADALAEHRRVLREMFARHDGVEVDTQGDAFFVAFARASDALAAARGAQAALNGPIRVRMGVHTGEPLVTDEGYVGIDVHRAARIAAAGHGGQVLVSQSTRELVGADALRDLGEHRLKDLTAPERIYQLGDDEFPPLKSLNATNLPVAASALVGRAREVREITALLSNSARLVTLTGPGGTGKTRLALQAAAELVEEFPGGVFFVPLAGVQRPDLVSPTITSTIGIHDVAALRDRHALLVLDNFEHLLEAAPSVADVLRNASRAKVLTTSRAPLRVEGEHEYAVEPLPEQDALELLTERARAVRGDFSPDAAAVEICRRLDGLPLALELAASRLRSLGSGALLERLDQRLPVLTSGRRDVPARQRTLRATIEWSYDLLPPELQRAFARLGVFATFTLEAAEEVAGATLDDVDALVEASLLKALGGDRFLMLETIRELAVERLAESGDEDAARRRHAEFFLALARSAHLSADETDLGPRHEIVTPEQNNVRAALDWATHAGEVELGLRLAVALEDFWVVQAPYEGARRVQALLDQAGDLPDDVRARAIRVLGGMTFIVGDFDRGMELIRQSLELFRSLGDEPAVAHLQTRLAIDARRTGDRAVARALAEESLAAHRRLGSLSGEAMALGALAEVDWDEGDRDKAMDLAARSAEAAATIGFTWWQMHQLYHQCEWSLALNRIADADEYGREALRVAASIHDRQLTVYLLAILARTAAAEGLLDQAGTIWGAVESEEARGPVGQWEGERDDYAAPVLALATPAFEEGRIRGRHLSLDDAVELALADAL
jgi:predicted ATPase/class 3 adenylate cyclase